MQPIQPAISKLAERGQLKMCGYIQSLLLIAFLFVPSLSHSQSPLPTSINHNPAAYRFETDTVWAKLNIMVIDFKTHFQIECTSDNPMEGWVLSNRQNDKIIGENENDLGEAFKLNVAKPFVDFELTVFVEGGNNQQIPLIVHLCPDKENATELTVCVPFVENPNRPYNILVKSLYEQAEQAYSQGDDKNAVNYLEKAEKVDASEPQVLAFLDRLKPQTPDNSTERFIEDSLAKAQKAEADKKIHDAESAYAEVLKVDPKNQTAVQGIYRLQAQLLAEAAELIEKEIKDGDYPKAKILLTKIKQDFPNDVRIKEWEDQIDELVGAGTGLEKKAKADEAYNLGLDSYRKDDFVSARTFWQEALKIDPQYIQAQQNLDRLNQEHPTSQ